MEMFSLRLACERTEVMAMKMLILTNKTLFLVSKFHYAFKIIHCFLFVGSVTEALHHLWRLRFFALSDYFADFNGSPSLCDYIRSIQSERTGEFYDDTSWWYHKTSNKRRLALRKCQPRNEHAAVVILDTRCS